MSTYISAPIASNQIPKGIPYIIGNEVAERFSFYGMRAILLIFMTQYLLDSNGQSAVMNQEEAKGYYHLFVSAVYFTPIFGALLADFFLGKFRTIILLSSIYCLGHFALALDDTRTGLAIGLTLIAIGAGGIKPCVSAHVGDQFGQTNQHYLSRIFSWFYFAINLGAFISTLLTPWLLHHVDAATAFAIPGVLMLLATLTFWAGRYRFVHIPPGGINFAKEVFSQDGLRAVAKLLILYIFIAVFWALFDQTGSSWVLQAKQMDLHLMGFEILPSQIQAANPLLVMLLIPIFSYGIYPQLNRFFKLTALRKIAIGLFITGIAFSISTWIQYQLDMGTKVTIAWQLLAYFILTSGEVMVSITCLEFSYTQAPRKMKSFIMAFFMMSISMGNLFTSFVNFFIQQEDGSKLLSGGDYFAFFTGLMFITALLFLLVIKFYKEKTYIHDEINPAAAVNP